MPYPNYFPVSYPQPSYAYPNYNQPAQQSTPQQMQTNIIWVQGEAGAKSYMVAPNTSVQLWDSERDTIYIKSADASGMPSIKILDYTVREPQQNQTPPPVAQPSFATKDEVNSLAEQVSALRNEIDGLAKRTPRMKKEVNPDE